ncbi:MAG: hypothetical protein FWD58_07315 [Firmicutes bacterium]|nr:hypothetical protein [Bacillota bacterium]
MYRNCGNNNDRGRARDNDEVRVRDNDNVRRDGGCGQDGKEPCNPHPHEYKYDKVVATWKTVRHYKITTYDTIEPVCTEGLCEDDLHECVGGDCCGRG